jgi:hypothetical protein
MYRRLALVVIVSLAAALPSGCASRTVDAPAASGLGTSATPSPQVRAMTIDERRTLIAPNFLAEIPAPFGAVVRGEAQGETAWDYELVVSASPAAVAAWYEDAYVGRDWTLVERTAPSSGSVRLVFTKGTAQTGVTVTPEGDGSSRVRAVVGVGTPVLQTQ